jgi:hypothetical protein
MLQAVIDATTFDLGKPRALAQISIDMIEACKFMQSRAKSCENRPVRPGDTPA